MSRTAMPSLRHAAVTIMDGTARGVPCSTLSSMSSFTKVKAFYSTFDYHHGYHNLKWISARMLAYPAPTSSTNSSSSSSLSSHSSWSDSHCVDETLLRRPVTCTMNNANTVTVPQRATTASSLSPPTGGLRWPSHHHHHRPIMDRSSSSPSSIPSPRKRLMSSPSISSSTTLSWSSHPTTTSTTSTSSSQKRSHVWHAGFLDEERAQDLDDTIRHKQRELVRLIRHLPDAVHDRISCNGGGTGNVGMSSSTSSSSSRRTNPTATTAPVTVVTSTSDGGNSNNDDVEDRTGTWRQPSVSLALIETILRTEQDILTLCQEYKMLTGDEYSRLPQPGTDDSATVRRMV